MSREASRTVSLVWAVIVVATVWLGQTGLAEPPAKLADRPCDLRVESELFSARGDEPVARSLTLFHHGVAWDFLELVNADTKTAAIAEIVLHDPSRERVVLVDPVRNLKTQIDAIRLERADGVGITRFVLQIDDQGVGIDKSTVTSAAFLVTRDGVALTNGVDYLFRYLQNSNQVIFESISAFPLGTYQITATTRAATATVAGLLIDRANNTLLPNKQDGSTTFDQELCCRAVGFKTQLHGSV
jgi:hypothetical protein